MSKKKSYMDRKNILSEGMISNFLYNLLPRELTRFLTRNDPEIKAIEKKIQQSKERGEEAYDEYREWVISKGGTDPKKFRDKKYREQFFKYLRSTLK